MRDLVQNRFRKRPATYTFIKVAHWAGFVTYTGKDVVACAPTGSGKTLTFWIPILMAVIMKGSIERLVESRASSIDLTVACCI
jgi:Lhr-like helicase